MVTIEADQAFSQPPMWAVLERNLIDLMDQSAEPVMKKYVRKDGSVLWPPDRKGGVDALDDAYESFHNWPLYYILGGHDKFRDLSLREWDAITRQFSHLDTGKGYPMVVKEYQPAYDWMHQGECYIMFYYLGLADPTNAKMRQRAQRFAGFYLNEDPEAPNYDPQHKIIRCAHNGSKGPAFWNFDGSPIWTAEGYGLPFYDVPGCRSFEDLKDPGVAARMGKIASQRRGRGDSATNLAAVGLVANAYLWTGDEKYRNWVKEYTGAWMDRVKANNGILPDNVGLSGKIGEHIDGKWYGANYGWTWPHGWHHLGDAVLVASQSATLLTGDASYLSMPRSQIDLLIDLGIRKDGTLYVPHKHADPGLVNCKAGGSLKDPNGGMLEVNGWYEFSPMNPRFIIQLWSASMDPKDLDRLKQLRDPSNRDWEKVTSVNNKDLSGHDAAWAAFLAGQFPEYPEKILQMNLSQVYQRLASMRTDKQDPKTYGDFYLQARNPITTEGLVQLTLGAPQPIYNGGLLTARLRYFDPLRRRPGLPRDVAALVQKMEPSRTIVQLVNLNPHESREVILQAGAFGEHHFMQVNSRGKPVKIDGKYLRVRLGPGAQSTLDIAMKAYANNPSYALPW